MRYTRLSGRKMFWSHVRKKAVDHPEGFCAMSIKQDLKFDTIFDIMPQTLI